MRGLLDTLFEAVVMVADEVSLFESLRHLDVELTVVDFSLTGSEGLRLIKDLRVEFPRLKLIVLSVHDEWAVCRAAISAGASAFVLKRAVATDLFPAVDAVRADRMYISPRISPSFPAGESP